jgi:hypothetical protein
MENELVRYSRAGDVFHYRWAARRCLRMLNPKFNLQEIVIEGSRERKRAGEYVIDVTEYSVSDENDTQEITYFQLKHTTVRKEQPFILSELKDTIEGFAKRYIEHFSKGNTSSSSPTVTFLIVTNRPIAERFKQNLLAVEKGNTVNARFQKTLKKYTGLNGQELSKFCASIIFVDGEGDYNEQRYELHAEISQLLAGTVNTPQIDSIVAMVQDKALPDSDGRILREDVLKRFGATSKRDLYPAPPEFEKIDNPILREQQQVLQNHILNASVPLIIHAVGGVGKSIFSQQVAGSLPVGSMGIVYDCFGGGRYRNRSEPRHRHRDALVQIVNELASHGLCAPLLAQSTALDDQILRKFLTRISDAAKSLKNAKEDATLVILIDAADNAEMAAREFGEPCFVHELLKEPIPDGCKLVTLCRTERIHLLQPSSEIIRLELAPFSNEETLSHLRNYFPKASDADGLEFHRLTNNGNPRVQAKALNLGLNSITKTLTSLGPSGTTIEKQIEAQLDFAVSSIKEKMPVDYQRHIDAICLGLATLPPLIPLNVLASVSEVDEATVKSFVADLGHSIWLSDSSVQFRDEPTETWFREKFLARIDQVASYITCLEPLAYTYPYVAEALPSLLLQAEQYNELISLALSDDFLPKENPIDKRNVQVYRLQFAFKAALRQQRYADAAKLALRAGEEVAGDKRQLELLAKNVDLIAPLQNEEKVQELAFRRMLRGGWDGSENVYSAALLSSVEGFKGEARGYLRAANNWLRLYFDEREKSDKKHPQERLKNDDIVELVFTRFNLFGVSKAVDFILSWKPPQVIYRITQEFIRRLIDAGNFDAIDEISLAGSRNQYLMIALAFELSKVARFPSADSLELCLTLLTTNRARIPKPNYSYKDTTLSAVVSFVEACIIRELSKKKVLRVLRHYIPIRASRSVSDTFQSEERDAYLRATALRCVLSDNLKPNLDELLPKEHIDKDRKHKHEQDIREFKERVSALLPWYIVRTHLLFNETDNLFEEIENASKHSEDIRKNRWRDSDSLPYEISRIQLEILALYKEANTVQTERFFSTYLKENRQIWIKDHINAVRGAFRLQHLSNIKRSLETSVYETIKTTPSEDPTAKAEWYIDLARAVLSMSHDDAAIYFNDGVEAVSKFGDEIVERWEAIVALGNRSAEGEQASPETSYRFIRCAELIGDNVAREKYFARNEAIKTCVRLSPTSALAALSRWRDRDVGWFDRQLSALAEEIVNSDFVSPSVGWALSAFFDEYWLGDFTSLCIEKEPSDALRQHILNSAIRNLRLSEATETSWRKLKQVAQQHSIENYELDEVLSFYVENPEKKHEGTTQQVLQSSRKDKAKPIDWSQIFDNLEITTNAGIGQAIERFNTASTSFRNHELFWQETYKRVDEGDALKILDSIVTAEGISLYTIGDALKGFPDDWHNKVSIKKEWPVFLKIIARRFASKFTNNYTLERFCKDLRIENNTISVIYEGVMDGLSENVNLADASTFFGFTKIAASFISPEEATSLLDFALERFEFHIDDQYADGRWNDWLVPPKDMSVTFAGFIWAALGSPRSEIRWQAAHCVRRLGEMGCEKEINALVQWMERDSVDAFGSHKFPFYNLHARQYLLIAIARVSVDYPQILRRHHTVFSHHALATIHHILIQKFSSEVALNIEKAFPKTYSKDMLNQFSQIGASQFPIKEMEKYNDKLESYWHANGSVDLSLDFYHGWDFNSYWFEPLGRVFGISGKQVEELATEVMLNEWSIVADGSYKTDPRTSLWSSSRHERETWHDHGSYPQTDNYSFYLSYHAMLSVAAKLLRKMPIVHERNWFENEWTEWFQRHLLTRQDGGWLADRRDPAPLLRPEWLQQSPTKVWPFDIPNTFFLENLLIERDGKTWINISGSWQEADSDRRENITVFSALVSPTLSQALLNALIDSNDSILTLFQEESSETEVNSFELKRWVWRDYTDNRLDKSDRFSGNIDFPPHQLDPLITKKLELLTDTEKRGWFLPNTDKSSLLSKLWSTNKHNSDDDLSRKGERMSASLSFLKKLCWVLECELVFEVEISRHFQYKSYMRSKDENGYEPPHRKVYILSGDGKLRDTETSYQLR